MFTFDTYYMRSRFARQVVFAYLQVEYLPIYNVSARRGTMIYKKRYIYLDYKQIHIVIESLVKFKNSLIQQGRYTDCIDELIIKVANAPVKR